MAKAVALLVFSAGLTPCALASQEKLDPWNFRDLELYLVDGTPPTCYQIFPGSRLARGVAGIGSTPSECEHNWQEEDDLGNFDGYNSPEFGQHYSGGSTLGCSTWLRMFADESLSGIQNTIKFEKHDEACDLYITIVGPSSAFEVKAKDKADGKASVTVDESSSPASERTAEKPAEESQRAVAENISGSGGSNTFIVILVLGVAVGAWAMLRQRRTKKSAESHDECGAE